MKLPFVLLFRISRGLGYADDTVEITDGGEELQWLLNKISSERDMLGSKIKLIP